MPSQKFVVEMIDEGNGKTRLLTRSILDSVEQLEQVLQMGQVEGFTSQLNKLEQLLAARLLS